MIVLERGFYNVLRLCTFLAAVQMFREREKGAVSKLWARSPLQQLFSQRCLKTLSLFLHLVRGGINGSVTTTFDLGKEL